MHYSDIAEQIATKNYRQNLGATPSATVASVISTEIKQQGKDSRFVRVSSGMYGLHAQLPQIEHSIPTQTASQSPTATDIEENEEITAIKALGMFWRRDWISWSNTPHLFGMQQQNSTRVDFCNQKGVYILYDGRETIYVGRSPDQPLGRRLYQHTYDRLNGRWDRFSWFGLMAVSESGELKAQNVQLAVDQVIIELEAVLIEALEPPQNRRRDDGLRAIEYIQAEDPKLRQLRMLDFMQEIKSKMNTP